MTALSLNNEVLSCDLTAIISRTSRCVSARCGTHEGARRHDTAQRGMCTTSRGYATALPWRGTFIMGTSVCRAVGPDAACRSTG